MHRNSTQILQHESCVWLQHKNMWLLYYVMYEWISRIVPVPGVMKGTVHQQLLRDCPTHFHPGTALVLRQVSQQFLPQRFVMLQQCSLGLWHAASWGGVIDIQLVGGVIDMQLVGGHRHAASWGVIDIQLVGGVIDMQLVGGSLTCS